MQTTVQNLKDNTKTRDFRPAKLDLTTVIPTIKRWAECKILGKNITIRSYSAACSYKSELFVYGGLQILNGILADFNLIDLGQEQGRFQWKEIPIQGDNPGPRAKGRMVCTENGVIYLIGGIKSTTQISNDIYSYTIENKKWKKQQCQGQFPALQSFGIVFLNDQKIILVCGYDGKINSQTNALYEYNIKSKQIKTLSPHSTTNPQPRSNCGVVSDGKNIYMFGGSVGDIRRNDMWKFSLETNKWIQLKQQYQIPTVRSGHIMQYIDGSILMYGGLHEVTWQLDDLYLYDIKSNKWKILEVDSARKKKQPIQSQKQEKKSSQSPRKQIVSPTRKKQQKYFTDTVHSFKPKQVIMQSRKDSNHPQNPQKQHHGSMLIQKRKKQFLQKKAQMLKIFEISEQNKQKYLSIEPISQAIKNSLQIVGDPQSKQHNNFAAHKLNNFGKTSISKFLQPLSNTVNVVHGKKPCARDGHCSIKMGQYIIIFGGDRHHMSFNDLYRLDTRDISKQFS